MLERFKGCILGLACGDALGGPLEFMSADEIHAKYGEVTEMIGGGRFNLQPGEYTDDTQMTLCIIRSIIENNGKVRPDDIAHRFVEWYQSKPKDYGILTGAAIKNLINGFRWNEAGRIAWENSRSAGNGGLMRCAPIGLLHYRNMPKLIDDSRKTCLITHYDPICQDSCVALNSAIASLVQGNTFSPDSISMDLAPEVLTTIKQSQSAKQIGETSGYTLSTLSAAFWALQRFDNYEEALIQVVNLGDDTDTAGAVTGALLGAKFGISSIPERWLSQLMNREVLEALVIKLWEISHDLNSTKVEKSVPRFS